MSEFRFPAYRKLSNNKSFYRIDDDRTFFEIQVIGNKCLLTQTKATQYPEILRVVDMLKLESPFEESTIDKDPFDM